MLALRLEPSGLHPFHASAVRYRDRTVLFLGGESNHGKSMGQIEANRRGAKLISTETTVIDERGWAVNGSKRAVPEAPRRRTERADKAAPDARVEKFFGAMPTWELFTKAQRRRSRHRAGHRRQLRAVVRRDDPLRAAVPDPPLAAELLPAQRAAAPGPSCRWSTPRPCGARGPTLSRGSPSGRITSSERPPRRCCWTRSSRCPVAPDRPMRASPTSDRPPRRRAVACSPAAPTRACSPAART